MWKETKATLQRISALNQQSLKPLKLMNSVLGIDWDQTVEHTKYQCRFIHLVLWTAGLLTVYGQWQLVWQEHQKHTDFMLYAETVCNGFNSTISMVKLTFIIIAQHKLAKLVHTVQSVDTLRDLPLFDLALENRQLLMQEVFDILNNCRRDMKRQYTLFMYNVLIISVLYLLRPVVQLLFERFYLQNMDTTLEFPLSAVYVSWQYQNLTLPPYALFYLINVGAVHICCFHAICFDGTFIVLSVHGLALVRILSALLRHCADASVVPRPLRDAYVRACVQLYERIYAYYREFDKAFSLIMLFLNVTSISVICLLMFIVKFSMRKDGLLTVKALFYVLAGVVEISIYNLNAERVATASEVMYWNWYNTKWYNESKEYKLITKIMLQRCAQPLALSVGGFTTLSAANYLLLLNRISSFYLLLLSLY